MRILGVTIRWGKLLKPRWTTFRLRRRDKDWQVGELVQVVYKPRSTQREVLGIAEIVSMEMRRLWRQQPIDVLISEAEAVEDGFFSVGDMMLWMLKAHGSRVRSEPLNKLTVRWKERPK